MKLIARFTPLRQMELHKPTSRNYSLPLGIMNLIRLKNRAWSVYTRSKRDSDKTIFRNLAKLVRARISTFRREREERILRSASTKKFYAYARERFGSNKPSYPVCDSQKNPIINDCDKANAFNSFFHSVFSADDHVSPDFPRRTNVTMALPSFTSNEVRAVLLEAKKSRACGPDGCPSLFLTMFPKFCFPLTDLFNMSLLQQTVPLDWKIAC